MIVKKISPAGRSDVYNMEVDGTHDFAVESGVIVHNCYDMTRYLCMEFPVAMPIRVPPKIKPYNPLDTDDVQYDPYEFYRRF